MSSSGSSTTRTSPSGAARSAWRSAGSRRWSSAASSHALRGDREGNRRRGARARARGDERPPVRNAGARVLPLGAGPARALRPAPATSNRRSSRSLRSEHNHFAKLWDDAPRAQRLVLLALADEPTRSLYAAEYAERHDLPAKPALQRAIGALVTKEVVARDESRVYRIVEPFFADWLLSEQEALGLKNELRGR